jgi:hypothetical protein
MVPMKIRQRPQASSICALLARRGQDYSNAARKLIGWQSKDPKEGVVPTLWTRCSGAGHASITTTERYDNQTVEALRPAAARLEADEAFQSSETANLKFFQGRSYGTYLPTGIVTATPLADPGGVRSNVSVGGRRQAAIGDVLSGVAARFGLSRKGRR